MSVGGQRHAPSALTPWNKTSTRSTLGWVGPRAGLDPCGKSRPLSVFDPQNVQPVASRYTDWAIPAHWISACVCVCVCVCVSVCVWMYISVYMCVSVWACVWESVCVCLWVCVSVYECMSVCVYEVRECVWVCQCVSVFLWVCICECVCVGLLKEVF